MGNLEIDPAVRVHEVIPLLTLAVTSEGQREYNIISNIRYGNISRDRSWADVIYWRSEHQKFEKSTSFLKVSLS